MIPKDLSFNVSKILHRLPKLSGLLSVFIDPITTQYTHKSVVTVGGLGDSYYEYLLKQWIQTGRKIDLYNIVLNHIYSLKIMTF